MLQHAAFLVAGVLTLAPAAAADDPGTQGTFTNSNDERSRYVGYHWRPLQLAFDRLRFSGGFAFALIDGYSDVRDGKTFPIVLPALSAEYRALGAHLIFVPHPNNTSAIALQVRLRVW